MTAPATSVTTYAFPESVKEFKIKGQDTMFGGLGYYACELILKDETKMPCSISKYQIVEINSALPKDIQATLPEEFDLVSKSEFTALKIFQSIIADKYYSGILESNFTSF
jgi:hypothetical protein